jgi:glycosyltransferase involved in cell wall biosynthesis
MGGVTTLAVSVVIPTYNRAELVPRAIRSALAALSPGDEIVVADDGSTDGTAAAVEAFGPPVRLLRLPHRGAGPARNAGLEAARGPLVAFLDSDDEWAPDKIALQRTFLEERPDVLFAFSDFSVRLEDKTEIRNYLSHWRMPQRPLREDLGPGVPYSSIAPLPPGRGDFDVHIGSMYLEEMRNNVVAAFTVIARKEEAGDALRFAEDLPTAEEWQAFGRLSRVGAGAFFDTDTAWQHGHSGPRLSSARRHVLADAWLTTLDRVWREDDEFIAEHGKDFKRTFGRAQVMRATSLARHGSLRQAVGALRLAGVFAITFRAVEWLSEVLTAHTPG